MEKLYSLCQNKTRSRSCLAWSCTDHELLISDIRVKLKKRTQGIVVPKYNVNHFPDEFKEHTLTRFALLNLTDQAPKELCIETRNVTREEWEKTILEVKRKRSRDG